MPIKKAMVTDLAVDRQYIVTEFPTIRDTHYQKLGPPSFEVPMNTLGGAGYKSVTRITVIMDSHGYELCSVV